MTLPDRIVHVRMQGWVWRLVRQIALDTNVSASEFVRRCVTGKLGDLGWNHPEIILELKRRIEKADRKRA